MGTAFEKIYDRSLVTIIDYKLDKLAKNDYDAFLLHLESILINSIPDFDGCLKSLDYEYVEVENEDETVSQVPCFVEDLDNKEQSILSKLMIITWFTQKVQDVTQFNGSLSTREFKKYSEANNLKQKDAYLNGLIEKVQQEITDYQLSHIESLSYFKDFA